MPSAFKGMATLAVWVLFVFGLVTLLMAFVRIGGAAIGSSDAPKLGLMYGYFGSGIGSLFLSVVAMKLRQGLG